MSSLPTPSAESLLYSQQLTDLVQQKIATTGGWISFADYMRMVLYTPELGYYAGGLQKIASVESGGGDFVTAPEISPLFSQALANQVAEVLPITGGDVLELGAGTGKMAAEILQVLAKKDSFPERYFILEVSAYLREIQRESIFDVIPKKYHRRVVWLDALPAEMSGVVLANEVLDALPVQLLHKIDGEILERGVTITDGFAWQDKSLQANDLVNLLDAETLPDGYVTEVCPESVGLVNSLAEMLQQGLLLLIDYGFGAAEYYHPQRNQGTLMCHYQHHAHDNPFLYPGLQDITTHVNFTMIAEAATQQGLTLEGYTNQAQFLMNCGLLDLLNQQSADDVSAYSPLAAGVQKLLSPAEMGELFKVIGFSRGVEDTLMGFVDGDKSHTL